MIAEVANLTIGVGHCNQLIDRIVVKVVEVLPLQLGGCSLPWDRGTAFAAIGGA
jgi:hypothetical protein